MSRTKDSNRPVSVSRSQARLDVLRTVNLPKWTSRPPALFERRPIPARTLQKLDVRSIICHHLMTTSIPTVEKFDLGCHQTSDIRPLGGMHNPQRTGRSAWQKKKASLKKPAQVTRALDLITNTIIFSFAS